MTHKHNDYLSNKKSDLQSNGLFHSDECKPMGFGGRVLCVWLVGMNHKLGLLDVSTVIRSAQFSVEHLYLCAKIILFLIRSIVYIE